MVVLLILLAFTLAGCTTTSIQPISPIEVQTSDVTTIVNHGSGYTLILPKDLYVWGSKKFFSTVAPPLPGEFPIYQLVQSSDYDMKIMAAHQPCSPSLTGASHMTPLPKANGKTEWGKVDYWDLFYTGDFPNMQEPLCRPPVEKGAAAYALCSEKDGKTVVICISQMQDDPVLAKEIFETFRWVR